MDSLLESKKYQSVLAENKEKTTLWANTINNFRDSFLADNSEEKQQTIVWNASSCLHEILQIFIRCGKFRDTFINPTFYINYEGLEAHITSKKTSHQFNLGFDFKGLYLSSYILNPKFLKNMPDEFWELFLRLSNFGDFKFIENEILGREIRRKYPEFFKPTKSNLFRLARNYFMIEILRKDDYQYCGSPDLGWLSIHWPPDANSIEEVLVRGSETFKILHQLNYMLWKVDKSS